MPKIPSDELRDLIPPEEMNFVGAGDFLTIGREFLRHFIQLGQLQPNEHVLDVGCGLGRMAAPLTQYLSARGSYEGFDIVSRGIEWCASRITPRFPHFRFRQVELFNKAYAPEGRTQAAAFRFPYDNGRFDFVFLTSVFTHMLRADLENYFREIVRVLKPGGRSFITFFLLNEISRELMRSHDLDWNFRHERGVYSIGDPEIPEAAVAYDEAYIRALYEKGKMPIREPIYFGGWCERPLWTTYQDIVIAQKSPAGT